MEVETRMSLLPRLDGGGLVRRGIVAHDMDFQLSRYGLFDQVEELFELGGPVPGGDLMSDHAGSQVERGVEVDGAVADVVMGAPLGRAGEQREHWLGAVQGLDLGLFV